MIRLLLTSDTELRNDLGNEQRAASHIQAHD
jgi:hypothetical protein